jgi:hypothetical protein
MQASAPGWESLRRLAGAQAPYLSAPRPARPGLCASCLGPARQGHARCYQCGLHAECAAGSLADLVVPVAYAAKNGAHARNLWLYKSDRPGAAAARAALRALLLVFLHDHGPCVWRQATGGPTHLAVVPSGRGRPGIHPLRALIDPCLALPWAQLSSRSPAGQRSRDLDPERFEAPRLPGARVLLLDDTWTSGASAQSAAMSLRLAGARFVAVVVLGRHLSADEQPGAGAACPPAGLVFRAELCAVHLRPAADGTGIRPGLAGSAHGEGEDT